VTISLIPEQSAALCAVRSFLRDDTHDAFILRGSAGTGKTTLIAQVGRALELVLDWAELHREELMRDWDLCQQHQQPVEIPPLE
jgi:predicted ATPase